MSRQYNPAVVAYKNIPVDTLEKKPSVKTRGLLAPSVPRETSSETNINEPTTRVARHVKNIRDRNPKNRMV
jgi:hypothetical protein|tara:strand:- start:736 stop:948 length:213 start_codon:yes stop_codon:yes gene_type:complete